MTADLVPYTASDGSIAHLQSPSPYWRIRKVEPTEQVSRTNKTSKVLLIVWEHVRPNGDKIVVDTYVREREDLTRLKAFLDAAIELPPGIRVKVATLESAPWDVVKPPSRRSLPTE